MSGCFFFGRALRLQGLCCAGIERSPPAAARLSRISDIRFAGDDETKTNVRFILPDVAVHRKRRAERRVN
jgi:hypothetical protein